MIANTPNRNALSEIESCSALEDQTLLARVRQLVRQDATLTATLLAHLGEVDERRLFLAEGHPSLFDYCTRGLGYSESGAYKRSQAARLCRRLPAVLAAVAERRVHLSGVCLLAPHLNALNVHELLDAAAGLSKRDVAALIHRAAAAPDLSPASPGREPAPGQAVQGQTALDLDGAASGAPSALSPSKGPSRVGFAKPPAARDDDAWLTPSSRPGPDGGPTRPTLPVSKPLTIRTTPSFLAKLDKARALASHAIRGGDTTQVLERALDLLIVALEKARFGAPKRAKKTSAARVPSEPVDVDSNAPVIAVAVPAEPVKAPTPGAVPIPSSPSRRTLPARRKGRAPIPASIRRAVFERDQGCCTFVGETGRRCGSRFHIQLHHRVPWALGGADSIENLTLACAGHNQLEADREGLARPAARRVRQKMLPF